MSALAKPQAAVALLIALLVAVPARAGSDGVVPQHDVPNIARSKAKIEEHIGTELPLDLTLRDEDDKTITLGAAMNGKPTILVPVYYRCPMLCTKVLNGVLEVSRQMPQNFSAGEQYTIVAVSMDPLERGDRAKAKKKAYLNGDPVTGQLGYGRPSGEAGWRFLTGTKENVGSLLDAVGFKFEFDKMVKEFDHPAGIVILSPKGKITRYFYGITYDGEFELDGPGTTGPNGKVTRPATTLHMSLVEAADGKGGSLWTKLKMICYRYDHLNQGYALNVLTLVRLGGLVTLGAVVVGVLWALRRERRKAKLAGATGDTNQAVAQAAHAPAPGAGGIA